MKSFKFNISPELLKEFPNLGIGVIFARVKVKNESAVSAKLMSQLSMTLPSTLTKNNYSKHASVQLWRDVFKSMNANPNYKSSVDALVRRVVNKEKMWSISSVVDLYNAISVKTLLPMGGYDITKLPSTLTLRHGREGETFLPLGKTELEAVTPKSAEPNRSFKC